MTEQEIQFEHQLNNLTSLKGLLIAAGDFDVIAQQEYDKQLELTFELIQ
ncbi:hypothetical protein [Turicibacter sanguinis]|nr:hypothetical protein [Turicibacter sanguinis]CUN16227.1 Uncharacterised protein [Turicibacter sanguinis]